MSFGDGLPYIYANDFLMNKKNYVEDFLADEEFVRWVKGSDPALDEFWKNWIRYNPDMQGTVSLARELILDMENEPGMKQEIDEAREAILGNILSASASDHPREIRRRNIRRHVGMPIFFKVAAMLLFFFAVGMIYEHYAGDEDQEVARANEVIRENPRGRMQTTLPDGTVVWMNSGTRISFASNMNDLPQREVTLEGEAYFQVKKDKAHPFIVNSRNFSTTALGTAFNVDAYPDQNTIAVSLEEGKVLVKEENKIDANSYILTPSHQLTYSYPLNEVSINMFDSDAEIGWIYGILSFNDADYPTVIRKLEKFYTVHIEHEGDLPAWKYTGRFENASLALVMERLSAVEQFHYSLNDQTLKIWK